MQLSFVPVSIESPLAEQEALAALAQQTFSEAFGANYEPSDLQSYLELIR